MRSCSVEQTIVFRLSSLSLQNNDESPELIRLWDVVYAQGFENARDDHL